MRLLLTVLFRPSLLMALLLGAACQKAPTPAVAEPASKASGVQGSATASPPAKSAVPMGAPGRLIGALDSDAFGGCGCSLSTEEGKLVYWDDGDMSMNLDGEVTVIERDGAFGVPEADAAGARRSEIVSGDTTIRIEWTETSKCTPGDEECEGQGVEARIFVKRGEREQVLLVRGSCGC